MAFHRALGRVAMAVKVDPGVDFHAAMHPESAGHEDDDRRIGIGRTLMGKRRRIKVHPDGGPDASTLLAGLLKVTDLALAISSRHLREEEQRCDKADNTGPAPARAGIQACHLRVAIITLGLFIQST